MSDKPTPSGLQQDASLQLWHLIIDHEGTTFKTAGRAGGQEQAVRHVPNVRADNGSTGGRWLPLRKLPSLNEKSIRKPGIVAR